MLEVDGVQLGQSIPIARFLARRYDLVGDNEMEIAQADMVIDCLHDQLNGRQIIIEGFVNHIILKPKII